MVGKQHRDTSSVTVTFYGDVFVRRVCAEIYIRVDVAPESLKLAK
jgi:hypothetical protein